MPYKTFVYENIVAVRWSSLTIADVDTVFELVRSVKHRQKRPVLYAGIQYSDYVDPSPEARKALLPKAQELAKLLGWYYLVIGSTGVQGTLQRSALRGLLVVARVAGYDTSVVTVVSSVDEMLKERERDLPCSVDELRRRMSEAGMLS